jgi:acyl-CoA reductase-like NAD-dependent aldehyde dehydrogenase
MSADKARANLRTALFINGNWVAAPKTFNVNEGATGTLLATCPLASPEQVDEAVKAAHTAFKTWSKTPAAERAAWLK